MLSLFFFLWKRKAGAQIRKTQSHIITFDETKEDNPAVRLGYFIIELTCSCHPTQHGTLAFRSGDAILFIVKVNLKWMPLNGHMI